MSRLLLAAAVAAILALVGAFVPFDGKTLVERWNSAPSASQFADRGWNELTSGWDRLWGAKPGSKGAPKGSPARASSGARPARAAGSAPDKAAPEPVEHHTDADRSALDRIVAEHAADRPAPRP
jgi:hypothetical protein